VRYGRDAGGEEGPGEVLSSRCPSPLIPQLVPVHSTQLLQPVPHCPLYLLPRLQVASIPAPLPRQLLSHRLPSLLPSSRLPSSPIQRLPLRRLLQLDPRMSLQLLRFPLALHLLHLPCLVCSFLEQIAARRGLRAMHRRLRV
jgi:hypothetical protein